MLKGRLTALASVAMLVTLTGGAAVLSVASGPLTAQYGPAAAAGIHQAVEATIRSRSFTRQGYLTGGSECAVPSAVLTFRSTYQAPDLYEEVDGDFGTFIVVGKSVYVRDDGANRWTVERQEADTALEDAHRDCHRFLVEHRSSESGASIAPTSTRSC